MDVAVVGGCLLTGLRDVTDDLTVLDRRDTGRWAVVVPFDGPPVCARFERVRRAQATLDTRATAPVALDGWTASLDEHDYGKGVDAVREAILAGDVYQVNLCRRLSTAVPDGFDILGRVCEYGTVPAPDVCREEGHPGLRQLVSTVHGRLRAGVGWAELLAATFPPGSVTGAPKLAAVDLIAALEPVPRGVYCGAVGWVDAESGDGALNVAIRTFWTEDGRLHLGTGAGVTWDSTPEGEWDETELKARRLLAVAAGTVGP